MDIHIGKEIEKKYQESGLKLSEFAKRLHTGPRNVYSIFGRKDISSKQLKKISEILHYNFFDAYQRGLVKTGGKGRRPSVFVTDPHSSTFVGLTIMVDLDGSKEKLEAWIEKLTAINAILHTTGGK